MYPIDKTNLDVLRFAHFLALAALTVRFIPRDWPALQSSWLRPAILCGQHSLEIFCLGVFLAFAAHFVMVEMYGGFLMQVLVSMAGVLIMIATAALISWSAAAEAGRGTPSTASADVVEEMHRAGRGQHAVACARCCCAVWSARRTGGSQSIWLSPLRRQPHRARDAGCKRTDACNRGPGGLSSTLPGPEGAISRIRRARSRRNALPTLISVGDTQAPLACPEALRSLRNYLSTRKNLR
jgi:hypothetical protein